MTYDFEATDSLTFYKYLENIKDQLAKKAPEWHLEYRPMDSLGDPKCPYKGYYNISRWDFSKGKDQTWPISIATWIFAYEKLDKNRHPFEFYLLNHHPLSKK